MPVTLSGTPFQVDVTAAEGEEFDVTVLVDGRELGSQTVQAGANRLVFEDAAIASGPHQLQVRSAAGTWEAELRALPGWLSILPPLVAIALAPTCHDPTMRPHLGFRSQHTPKRQAV